MPRSAQFYIRQIILKFMALDSSDDEEREVKKL